MNIFIQFQLLFKVSVHIYSIIQADPSIPIAPLPTIWQAIVLLTHYSFNHPLPCGKYLSPPSSQHIIILHYTVLCIFTAHHYTAHIVKGFLDFNEKIPGRGPNLNTFCCRSLMVLELLASVPGYANLNAEWAAIYPSQTHGIHLEPWNTGQFVHCQLRAALGFPCKWPTTEFSLWHFCWWTEQVLVTFLVYEIGYISFCPK